MHEAYFNYLKKFSAETLNDDEKALIRKNFTPHRIRRRQFLLQAGDVCRKYAFIVKGAMRMYSVDDKGQEHIVRLGIEEWWMGDRESFTNLTPSRYHIDALEDCELLCINNVCDLELQDKIPAYVKMKVKLDQHNEIANNRRVTSAISDCAEKRYSDLVERYPVIAERFPQHILASYLGINKDTLSRVKRQYSLK